MAAGHTAKDKRAKDTKYIVTSTPQKKKRHISEPTAATDSEGRLIKCESFSNETLPLTINLKQLLKLIETKGTTVDWPFIHLKIYHSKSEYISVFRKIF